MQTVINIVSLVIASAGGTGFIIFLAIKFIGNNIANALSEKYKASIEKDLEKYKGEINYKLNKLDKIEEKALYISKVNYDNEYCIYRDIWPKLIKCFFATSRLYPNGIENVPIDEEEKEKYEEKKYKDFCQAFNEYSESIEQNAPFYPEEFYNVFTSIKEDCFFIGDKYKMYTFDVKYNESFASCRDLTIRTEERIEIQEKIKAIIGLQKDLQKRIRNYINNLKLKEEDLN